MSIYNSPYVPYEIVGGLDVNTRKHKAVPPICVTRVMRQDELKIPSVFLMNVHHTPAENINPMHIKKHQVFAKHVQQPLL